MNNKNVNETFNKKDQTIEYLRAFCAIVVLIDHIAIGAIRQFAESASRFDTFAYYGIQHWSHFAVPIFLMISGYLLLNPQKEIDYHKVFARYVKRMLIILASVGTFFALIEIYFDSRSISIWSIFLALGRVFEGKGWDHMWYLYVLIGLYLVLPLIKAAYSNLEKKTIDIFLVILLLFSSVLPIINNFWGIDCGVDFPILSVYLLYFMLGRWVFLIIKEHSFNKYGIYFLCIIVMILPIVISYLEHYWGYTELKPLIEYHSPLVIADTILIIIVSQHLLGWAYFRYFTPVMNHVAKNSFGIYVFHMLWINVIYKFLHYNPVSHNWIAFIFLIIVVLVLSDITTAIFRKIPFLGKYI